MSRTASPIPQAWLQAECVLHDEHRTVRSKHLPCCSFSWSRRFVIKESGDDEKHINAHESAGKRRVEAVIEQYQSPQQQRAYPRYQAENDRWMPPELGPWRAHGVVLSRLISVNCHCLRVHTVPSVGPPAEWRKNDQHRRKKWSCGDSFRSLRVLKPHRVRRPRTPNKRREMVLLPVHLDIGDNWFAVVGAYPRFGRYEHHSGPAADAACGDSCSFVSSSAAGMLHA